MEEKTLEELQAEIAVKQAEARAKIEAEANIITDPTKALTTKLNMKVADKIDTSKNVDTKIEQMADKLVDKGLIVQDNKATAQITLSEDEMLDADFQKNKEEYLYHGINHKVDKQWKRSILLIINDIWFVIWAIVSCFTIVPVSTFLSRIGALKGFIKGVALVLGIMLLLMCLGGLTYLCLKRIGKC